VGLFRRRRAAPDWASFLEPAEFAGLVRQVRGELDRRRVRYALDEATGTVTVADGGSYGLDNLFRLANASDERDWPELVANHVRILFDTPRPDVNALLADHEAARARLRVRVLPTATAEDAHLRLPVAPGLDAVVALDLEDSVVIPPRERFADWEMDLDEVFRLALEQTRHEPLPPADAIPLGDGTTLLRIESPSFFTATAVLFLADHVEVGEAGALVAVPSRHTLLVHVIEDAHAATEALHRLASIVPGLEAELPGGLSDTIYWAHEDALEPIPTSYADGRLTVEPPPAFVAMLGTLGS
jgi:hypothetical protein